MNTVFLRQWKNKIQYRVNILMLSFGTVYFIDPGHDIPDALNRLRPGDTLFFRPGRYKSFIVDGARVAQGTWLKPIRIASQVPFSAHIYANEEYGIALRNTRNWWIEGFSVISTDTSKPKSII